MYTQTSVTLENEEDASMENLILVDISSTATSFIFSKTLASLVGFKYSAIFCFQNRRSPFAFVNYNQKHKIVIVLFFRIFKISSFKGVLYYPR